MVEGRGKLITDNGSKLYWYKEPSKNVGVALLVPFGPIYEEEKQRGITHLLEHMLLKSNRKYSSREMNKIIELSGGEWNASTYWDSFVIQMEFLAPNHKRLFDVLESILLNDRFLESEYEREKEVVLTEIKEQMNYPLSRMYITIRNAIYGNSDLGEPIGGYPETVENISLEDLLVHKSKVLKSEGIIMVLVGGVNDEILKNAKEVLEKIEEGRIIKKVPTKKSGSDITLEMDTGDICYVAYGWELPILDMYRVTMLEYLMVIGSTSLLYDKIREELGLAYSFGSSSDMTHNTGYISFSVEGYHCDKRELMKNLILEVIYNIKENDISDDLIRGKKNAIEFSKEKYRYFYAERAEDTARRIYLGDEIESINYAQKLIEMDWKNLDKLVNEGYFVEITPSKNS